MLHYAAERGCTSLWFARDDLRRGVLSQAQWGDVSDFIMQVMPCDESRINPFEPQQTVRMNPAGGSGRVGPIQSAGGGAHLAAPAQRHHQCLGATGAGSAVDMAGRVAVSSAGVAVAAHPHRPRVPQGSVHSLKILSFIRRPDSLFVVVALMNLSSERFIELSLCT